MSRVIRAGTPAYTNSWIAQLEKDVRKRPPAGMTRARHLVQLAFVCGEILAGGQRKPTEPPRFPLDRRAAERLIALMDRIATLAQNEG